LLIRCSDINKNQNPILYGIVESYEYFYYRFSEKGSNYINSYVFENNLFLDPHTEAKIDRNFFGMNLYNNSVNIIRTLRFRDCFENGGFKTVQDFRNLGLPLTFAQWMRLRGACTRVRQNARNHNNIALSEDIETFVTSWKKGGKRIRLIMENSSINPYLQSRCFNTFIGLTSVVPTTNEVLPTWCAAWNNFALKNDFRSFIFKFRYNILPLNNRVNAYRPEVDPGCTFCKIINPDLYPRDSLAHCFLQCMTVTNWLRCLMDITDFNLGIETEEFKNLYWYGIFSTENLTISRLKSFILIFDLFRYLVFKNRCRKRIPTNENFVNEFHFELKWILNCSKKTKLSISSIHELTRLLQALG
jgi:hypothetical protein